MNRGLSLRTLVHHVNTASQRRLAVYLVTIFATSRILYFVAGVRFDERPLDYFWQYLDPHLLKNALLESVLYLHSQPPLFNLFLGLILKVAPGESATLVFYAVFLLFSCLSFLALFLLMKELGVSASVALPLSTLFIVSPSYVLYEHFLFYTFPLMALLLVSAVLLYRTLLGFNPKVALLYFSVILLICGIRSLFHLAYYVAVALALLFVTPRRKLPKIGLVAVVPFLLLLSFYTKNLIIFGHFTTSTWLGMGAAKVTVFNVPAEERSRLVKAGELSTLSLIYPFSALDKYPVEHLSAQSVRPVPALIAVKKSTGAQNYNHFLYIPIAGQYLMDAKRAARLYPSALLRGLLLGWLAYCRPPSQSAFLAENRERIHIVSDAYDRFVFGKLDLSLFASLVAWPSHVKGSTDAYVFLTLGTPLLLLFGLASAAGIAPRQSALTRPQRLLILYMCGAVLYVAVVGNSFELGENNRFRLMTDPFLVVLLGLALQSLHRRRRLGAPRHLLGLPPKGALEDQSAHKVPLLRAWRVQHGG